MKRKLIIVLVIVVVLALAYLGYKYATKNKAVVPTAGSITGGGSPAPINTNVAPVEPAPSEPLDPYPDSEYAFWIEKIKESGETINCSDLQNSINQMGGYSFPSSNQWLDAMVIMCPEIANGNVKLKAARDYYLR